MKISRTFLLLILVSLQGIAGSLHAQTTLLGWDFFGQSSPATLNATTKNGNLDSTSTLSRGAGAASSSASNSFRTTGFQNNGISTANTDYFQFAVSATSGYSLSLNSITANFAGTSSFAVSPGVTMQYAYSTDGTNFTLIGSSFVVVGSGTSATVDLSGVSALQSLAASTDITLRFYASGQTNTGGWGFTSASSGTNGLAVTGTLTQLAVPSLTWSGGSGTWDTSSLNFNSGATAWSNTTNATDKAIFPTASETITVATGITAGSVQFDANNIALSGGSLVNGNASSALTAYVTNVSDSAALSTSLNDGGKGFTKDGSGTLVLSGTQTDVTGGITVTNGTLKTDAAVVSGKNISNNATLEFTSGTYATGTIANAGILLKSGAGTATIDTAVTGSGATTITGGTLAVGASQGGISTGALAISGGGSLDLNSRDATVASISLTGSSIANAGTLTLGASGALTTVASSDGSTIAGTTLALGTTSHTFSIADGAATSDLTISAGLTGTSAGTLTKSGNGTLTLSGNNSAYAGNVTLGTNSGLLVAASATALGSGLTKFNGGTLTGNGSALTLTGNTYQLQGSGGTIGGSSDLTLNGNWTDTGASNLNLTVTNTGNTTLAGNFTITAAKTINTIVGTNLTMSGVLSGSGSGLAKSGAGTLVLSGANTYTGNTTISNGSLKLGASNAIADAVNVVIDAVAAGTTALFDLDGNSDTIAALTFGGGTPTSTSALTTGMGTLTLGGDLTYDATNHPLGSTLSGKLDLGASRTFNIGDSSNAASDLSVSAGITGSGFSLTKSGAGTLALSGNNTYSGGTTVNAGTLAANSATALGSGITTINSGATVAIGAFTIGSNFTINSGGILTGTSASSALGGIINGPGGTLAGTLAIASGGSVAPGSSPGLLNITGAVTFNSGSHYTWELGAFSTTTPGTNFDQIVVANGGSLSLLAGATLVPTFAGTATSPTAGNGFWTSTQSWKVVTNSSGTGTVTGTAFAVDNSSWSGNGAFAASLANNEVLLTWTPSAIPEPSTYATIFGLVALGGAVWHRRRGGSKPMT